MEDHRLPKIVLYGKLSTGNRNRGAPKKRFKDSLKKSLLACNIDSQLWSDLGTDRGAYLDEEKRMKEGHKRGEKRKAALEELDNLKGVKKRMKANIEALLKSAD